MAELPKSLDIGRLLARELPGDTTLGEARAFMMKTDAMQQLQKMTKNSVRIRILDNEGREAPDDMLLREMQRRVAAGTLHISIDDGEGGMRVKENV